MGDTRLGQRAIPRRDMPFCRIVGSVRHCPAAHCTKDVTKITYKCERVVHSSVSLKKGGQNVDDLRMALTKALDERLCVLAHELNNGLAVIAGHCEIVADHVEPEVAERLYAILDMVHRLANRINGHDRRFPTPQMSPSSDQMEWPQTKRQMVKYTDRHRIDSSCSRISR
jgi:hypothetical protein